MSLYSFLALSSILALAAGEVSVICEHDTAYFSCPRHKFVNIKKADYGRVDNTLCPAHYAANSKQLNAKTPCHYPEVTQLIKKWCHKKKKCSFVANNKQLQKDPCVGTYKYLTVEYACQNKNKLICEGETGTISCLDSTKVIRIIYAKYGRKSRFGCQNGRKWNSPELNPSEECKVNIKDAVVEKCNNKQSCNVEASNGALALETAPCPDIYKFAHIGWKCVKDPALVPEPMSMKICEHDKAEVACPAGKKVNILKAVYGRSDTTTCSSRYSEGHRAVSKTDCAKDVAAQVKAACQGQQSCAVAATNAAYSDPCWGTFKFLDLQYSCAHDVAAYKPEPITMDICERKNGGISCPGGKKISIQDAVYGRTDTSVCNLGKSANHRSIRNTKCALNVKNKVTERCDGKDSCSIRPNNDDYTDPCRGTYKYLALNYSCV